MVLPWAFGSVGVSVCNVAHDPPRIRLRNIENTGDPVVTQRLARHKDGRTTQGYMHARESRVMAAVVRLNQ